jgi:Ca-activated chloride channel family protein
MNKLLYTSFMGFEFLDPNWLWLLCIVPIIVWFLFHYDKFKKGHFTYSDHSKNQQKLELNWVNTLRKVFFITYGIIISLLIFAIAKPCRSSSDELFNHHYKYGIDIIIAMDISASMLARDFDPNRLEASKEVAKEFINGRNGDRIGLVVYEGEAYTACPATLDYDAVKKQIDLVQPGNLEGGTAIGTGLGTAVNRLRKKDTKSKVIILLTDGSNNSGTLSPETAAGLAKEKKIRVYTIGVGSIGMAETPIMTPLGIQFQNMPVNIDEPTLKSIATITGGRYFRAKDLSSLRYIYNEIDLLEKSRIKHTNYQSEPPSEPAPFVLLALLLFMSIITTKRIILKTND